MKKAAKERLDELVDPAITELQRIMDSGESDSVRLAAVKDILDRTGYKPRENIDLRVYHQVRQEAERLAYELGIPLEQVLRDTGVSLPTAN